MSKFKFVPSFSPAEIGKVHDVLTPLYPGFVMQELEDRGMDVAFLTELLKALPDGCCVAGGAIESIMRGEKVKDYDVFFTNERAYEGLIDQLQHEAMFAPEESFWAKYNLKDLPFELLAEDPGKVRFINIEGAGQPKVQLIKTMAYNTPDEVIDSFDFTAAMGVAYRSQDGETLRVATHPMMPLDVARKRLVLHRVTYPASTMRRAIKYANKGYYACPGALAKLAEGTLAAMRDNPDAGKVVYVD